MALSPANSHGNGYPLGLTGATAATRYVGGTTTGAPASGTFAVGDFVVAEDGGIQICTVAGSPGTWVAVGGSSSAVACRAKRVTSTTAVSTATWTPVPLNGEDYDTSNMHDNSTNPSRITVPSTGYYQCHAYMYWAGAADTSIRYVAIAVDGTRIFQLPGNPASNAIWGQGISDVQHVSANSYIEMHVYQATGSNLDVQLASYLAVALIGA